MGKRCAVPGCSTGDPADVKRRKLFEKKQTTLFSVPKDPDLANAWTKAVKAPCSLTHKQFVCQFHFDNSDVITHFTHTMPNGEVSSLERQRYMLREGAVPVSVLPQPGEISIECSRASTSSDVQFSTPAVVDDSMQREPVIQSESSFDGSSNSDSEEDMVDEEATYTIDDLITDLKSNEWREGWAWNRNVNGIVFVHLTPMTLTPRVHLSINNDLTTSVSLADKQYVVHCDKVNAFVDVTSMMTAIQRMKECVGTSLDEESRSTDCSIFVEEAEIYARSRNFERCFGCRNLRHTLIKRKNRPKVTKETKSARLKTSYRLLKKRHITLLNKVDQLKSGIRKAQKECNQRKKGVIREAIASLPPEQQEAIEMSLMSAKAKKPQGRRYTKQWVYNCLLLRIKSKKAYTHLRDRDIMPLPHPETLARYIRKMGSAYGFQDSLFECMKTKGLEMHPSDRRGSLLVDEMQLSAGVSLDRKTLLYTGFTYLGDHTPVDQKDQLGDHALIFMYQPFRGPWVQAVACFLSKGCAKSDTLQKLILECIILVEKSGFFVDAVVSDGASWNRGVWTALGVNEGSVSCRHPGDVLDDTIDSEDSEETDIASEGGRRLWFLSDFPHLIKTMRNGLVSRDETLTPDGTIKLAHWEAIIDAQKASGSILRVAFLTKDHIRPQHTARMRVSLAFELFSDRTLAAMRMLKDTGVLGMADAGPTIAFIQRVNGLIKAMMARTPDNALRTNNESMQAILDFQEYLEAWEIVANENDVPYLTIQTLTGLKVSLQGVVELYKFLRDEHDFQYLMTTRVNQDPLERFNGMMRSACGSNEHPDATQCAGVFRLLSMYSLIKPPRGSNVSATEILRTLIGLEDAPAADERKEEWLDRLDQIVGNGHIPDNLEAVNTETFLLSCEDYGTYAQAYVAGYVARMMMADTKCTDCSEALKSDKQHERDRFISLMNKGDLIYPSEALFCLLKSIESAFHEVIGPELHLTASSLFDVMDVLSTSESLALVGCSEHRKALTKRVLHYYVRTMGHFVGHSYNRAHNENREKTRKFRKMAKLY